MNEYTHTYPILTSDVSYTHTGPVAQLLWVHAQLGLLGYVPKVLLGGIPPLCLGGCVGTYVLLVPVITSSVVGMYLHCNSSDQMYSVPMVS